MSEYGQLFFLGIMLSLALTPLSRRLAFRIGAIDHPDERRVHAIDTARLGGPAILLALVIAMLLAAGLNQRVQATLYEPRGKLAFFLSGALMVTLVGAIDDVRALRPVTKLLVETAAACVVVFGGYQIGLPAIHHLDWLSLPLSVFFIVVAVNAINLVDGLDGLAVGSCLIITATLFLLCRSDGHGEPALTLAASGGVMVGFLRYNFHPARIFLGDSGALLLGFIVGVCAISASHQMTDRLAEMTPFLAFGLPLLELCLTVVRRILREVRVAAPGDQARGYKLLLRRPALFSADRDHVHHRLLLLGVSHRNAVLLLYGAGAVICAGSFALARLNNFLRAPLLAALVIASVAGIRSLGYRELKRLRSERLQRLFDSRGNAPRTADAPP
jgi:UDP-GlcNAc:undecaprenyl-phosphate GlcNAc-1-phosphate transferase